MNFKVKFTEMAVLLVKKNYNCFMNNKYTRRNFVKVSILGAGALMAFHATGSSLLASNKTKASKSGWNGSLITDINGVFDLPQCLSYKEIMNSGDLMSDGLTYGQDPDGMELFELPGNKLALVVNHETSYPDKSLNPATAYKTVNDIPYSGGTSTIIMDKENIKVEHCFRSLTGTVKNCAGGKTPWNTWISCEETYQDGHGYAFEVDPQKKLKGYNRLSSMGRFKREAVAVDPADTQGCVYQTEDSPDGLFYKFVPENKNDLKGKGKLYALKVDNLLNADNLKNIISIGDSFNASWVEISDPQAILAKTKHQGIKKGATTFNGSEGIIIQKNNLQESEVFFTCKAGGYSGFGQIWKYNPAQKSLTLFYESSDKEEFWMGDNITISPWGDLIVCEDNDSNACKLIGFTPNGKIYTLGKVSSQNSTEIAGVCFSPDGTRMGLNLQHAGKTLIISGDWAKIRDFSLAI